MSRYNGEMRSNVGYIQDIMATFVDVAEAEYPKTYHNGNTIFPMEGTSLMPAIENKKKVLHEYIFGEHYDNRYVRWKNWKAVKDEQSKEWELYDIDNDRTERNDLSAKHPKILKQLTEKWDEWANSHFIYPKGKEGHK
jgi:arylsulfatase